MILRVFHGARFDVTSVHRPINEDRPTVGVWAQRDHQPRDKKQLRGLRDLFDTEQRFISGLAGGYPCFFFSGVRRLSTPTMGHVECWCVRYHVCFGATVEWCLERGGVFKDVHVRVVGPRTADEGGQRPKPKVETRLMDWEKQGLDLVADRGHVGHTDSQMSGLNEK